MPYVAGVGWLQTLHLKKKKGFSVSFFEEVWVATFPLHPQHWESRKKSIHPGDLNASLLDGLCF